MKRIVVDPCDVLSDEEMALWKEVRLLYEHEEQLIRYREGGDIAYYTPDGALLALRITNCVSESARSRAYPELGRVKGDPDNRPSIIGVGARQPRIRKDGTLSRRVMAPREVLKALANPKTDYLGYFDYEDEANRANVIKRFTGWTLKRPQALAAAGPLITEVDRLHRQHAPAEYAAQLEAVQNSEFRLLNTIYSTLYVLRNMPCAVHVDSGDLESGSAWIAITTMGDYQGSGLCYPRYRVLLDFQPGDLVICDAHEWHANFPLMRGGERISCVFLMRKRLCE